MFRNSIQLLHETRMNFVFNQGALGDVITSLPAIIFARQMWSEQLVMKVWAPSWQKALLEHLLAPYGKFEVLHFEDFPMKKAERTELDMGMVALNQMPYNTHTRNRVHMVDFAFNCLLDAQPESMAQRNYPTEAPLGLQTIPGRYVVFPVGATSDNKLFRASVMAPIIKWVSKQGMTPVIVGTKTSHTNVEAQGQYIPIVLRDEVDKLTETLGPYGYFDMREKTTLLQLRDLCGHAAAVVGVDGGTLHLAGTTDVSIVYGLTTTLPQHRFIVRQGDPLRKIRYITPRDLECAGCQSNWVMSRQDFRFCAYGDNKCTEQLSSEDFINSLKELGL